MPFDAVSKPPVEKAVRHLMWDAACATVVGALNSGVVLVAYALYLGASNKTIGLLASIPLLTQLLQAPAVLLVERVRRRRLISVASLFIARLALPLMAVLSLLPNRNLALVLLVCAETVHCAFNAVAGCSWNSWIRDLVPEQRLGLFFARRTIWATAIGLAGSLLAGFVLERTGRSGPEPIFMALYGLGFVASLGSTWQLSRVAEPLMPAPEHKLNLRRLLRAPLRDINFRRVIVFLASWQFAVNAATPFFTVYFLNQLNYGMGFVMILTAVSQAANMVVLRTWGRIGDRFSNKTVLATAAPVFLACIGAMVFASQIDDRVWLSAFLISLHIIMGMASAGVGLASGAITMKLAPRGGATAYLAASALIGALAAGVAPIIGGLFADFFAARELSFFVTWRYPSGVHRVFDFRLTHWDFYFLMSALLGVYAMHRLSMVGESGEVSRERLLEEVLMRARAGVRNASPVVGLRAIASFPGGALLSFNQRRQAFSKGWQDQASAHVVWEHGTPQELQDTEAA
jgi:MFS family permease